MDYSDLKEQIIDGIKQSPAAITNARALNQKIANGTATYKTAADYSKVLGEVTSKSIGRNIVEGIADDELRTFAVECLAPVYRQCQETMLSACKSIQKGYNSKAGIALNPVEVPRDESRIEHIIERFSGDETFDTLTFLTEADVAKSITRGAVTDSIRENSRFQSNAGLKVLISRSDGSGCCDWCAGLVGTYDSFDKLPSDFWGIHRGCKCVIDYRVGKTHEKISFKTNDDGSISKETEQIIDITEKTQREKLTDGLWESYLSHVERNGLNASTDISVREFIERQINIEKLGEESQKVFADTIIELSREYDTTLQQVRTMDKMEALGNSNSFAFVSHNYETDSSVMVINPVKCSDAEKMAERIIELSNTRYSVTILEGREPEYIATHEFAHTLIDMGSELNNKRNWLNADYDKIRSARKEINSVYEEYISAYSKADALAKEAERKALLTLEQSDWDSARLFVEQRDAILLSKYSLTNADEFMAEAFTASRIGILDNEYGRKVVDIVERYFKR